MAGAGRVIPGSTPPVLARALTKHTPERISAFVGHVQGGTSANYLADWLKRAGTPVSATTIKQYRRSLSS